MRALQIDSTARTVTEVYIDGSLESLQAAVGGYIEHAVWLDAANCVIVDEEGLLKNPQHFFTIEGAHQTFAGDGVVIGSDEGETTAATTSLAWLSARVGFLTLDEVRVRKQFIGRVISFR